MRAVRPCARARVPAGAFVIDPRIGATRRVAQMMRTQTSLLENKLETITRRQDTLEGKLDSKLDTITSRQDKLDGKLEMLDCKLDTMLDRLR